MVISMVKQIYVITIASQGGKIIPAQTNNSDKGINIIITLMQ